MRNLFVGVDIGGTFTDLVIGEEGSERIHKVKTLTTPHDPVEGVMTALAEGLEAAQGTAAEVRRFVHATTLSTNLVLERKGARVAYVATKGFGDMFGIGKRLPAGRANFDMLARRPDPFVPRDMVFELPERMGADGKAMRPLTDEAAHEVARQVAQAEPEGVAICLLHSYRNDAHEVRFAQVLREHLPDAYIAVSSKIWPEMFEYERGATSLISAYVGPTFSGYVRRLERALADHGLACPLQIMQSSGGLMAAADAAARAAYTLESGPAAGVVSAARLGEECGYPNLISFDMGGTTAKAGLVDNGQPRITHDFQVGASTSAEGGGGGEPIRLPVIDLAEVGAGGGSLASIDVGGFLRVGPQSAGADPGPACYAMGGQRSTVTDANLVLGYLDPTFFLGGRMKLDLGLAKAAIARHVADPLGIGVTEAAWRIHELANTSMGGAVRMVTVNRGADPRHYTAVAFGGAGPLHIVRVAEEFDIPRVLIPPFPGVRSAFGLLQSDLSYDFVKTCVTPAAEPDLALIESTFAALESRARAEGMAEGLELKRLVEIRYTHQSLRLRIALPSASPTRAMLAEAEARYREDYFNMCAIRSDDSCTVTSCWIEAIGIVAKPAPILARPGDGEPARALKGTRDAFFHEAGGHVRTEVYDRERLMPGDRLTGPAIVEEPESTTILPPAYGLRIDEHRNLLIERIRS